MAAEDSTSEAKNETKTETEPETKSTRLYTRAEVEEHNNSQDTWIIIHNKVYDVTAFLGQHPGGEEALIDQAGKDGTDQFEDIGHSSDARELMEQYYIGDLVPTDRLDTKEKRNWSWSNEGADEESSSGSWRSWLIPVLFGVLVTLVYRYFINAH